MKTCSKCRKEKTEDNFYGRQAECKLCFLERSHARYERKKGEILIKQKEYYQKNKNRILEKVRDYTENNRPKVLQNKRNYYRKNRTVMLAKEKKRYEQNHTEMRERNNRYLHKFRKENKEANDRIQKRYVDSHREQIAARQRKKWRENDRHRLRNLMSCRMRLSLKGGKNGESWESLVGYSVEQLERSLKHKIPKGHTWNDFLEGRLHIDHKIPVAAFNYKSFHDIDFKRCWSLKNLQLLPSLENIKKGAKLNQPFQPSLLIEVSL